MIQHVYYRIFDLYIIIEDIPYHLAAFFKTILSNIKLHPFNTCAKPTPTTRYCLQPKQEKGGISRFAGYPLRNA
jgi:hypothetical protein